MKKKIFMFLFCAITAVASLAAVNAIDAEAATEGYYTYTVSNNEATILDVDTSISDNITIPSKLGGYPVTHIANYAFYDCGNLTSIIIPDGVTIIGDYAFYGFGNLKSISIPYSVIEIGASSFQYCVDLETISLPGNIATIYDGAFLGCTKLTSISIPYGVTRINNSTFASCPNLKSISIPSSIKEIGSNAFYGCSNLNRVNITDMAAWCAIVFDDNAHPFCNPNGGNLYINNEKIENLIIPYGVKTIGNYAFYNCRDITSISIPATVTAIGEYAFYACDEIESLHITDLSAWFNISFGNSYSCPFNTATNISANGEFYINGEIVKEISVPNGVKTIKRGALYCFTGITALSIPDSVEIIEDNAFGNCVRLKDITIPDSVTTIADGVFFNCASLTSITIPDSVNTIGDDAFYYCNNLQTVYKPASATWDYGFESTTEVILYDYIITYILDGDIFSKEYILESQSAKLLTAPEGYVYEYSVNGQEWKGENVFEDAVVTITKTAVYNVTYVGDYEENLIVKAFSNIVLPEAPYGYTYTFTADGKEFTGESITEDVTVTVTKTPIIYTVTYNGDYVGAEKAAYLTSVILPTAPYGYTYTFTANGKEFTSESITGDVTVTVTKSPIIYTVTYKGDYVGTEKAAYLSRVTLPKAPQNYIYTFTVNGAKWTGESITDNVTVTVTKLCDLAELSVKNLEEMTKEENLISGKYYGRIFVPQVTVSENATYKLYSEYECINEGTAFSLKKGENTGYVKVIAESGREKIYTLKINRDIPDSLGKLTVVQTVGGSLTFEVDTKIVGNPSFYLYYGLTQNDMVSMPAKYFSDTNTIFASGLKENTEYYLKIVAVYDEISIESSIVKEKTGITLSGDCYVIKTNNPPGGKITHSKDEFGMGEISDLAVTNKYDSITIDVEVSPGAKWGLYDSDTATNEIDKTVALKYAGRTVTRYIKVTSEDGEHQRIYKISIYRQSKSEKPTICIVNNVATITSLNSDDTIKYTVDTENPSENYGILYTGPFAVSEGTIIKAIAKQQNKDEYSDITICRVSNKPSIRIIPLDGGVFKVEDVYAYNFKLESSSAVSGKVVIAFYNENKFVDMIIKDINAQTESYIEGEARLKADATKYKAFIWESLNGLNPLADFAEGNVE